MTTITISTTNNDIIEAIKALVAKNPKTATIEYDDEDEQISIPALNEAIAEYERGGEVIRCKDFDDYQRKMLED